MSFSLNFDKPQISEFTKIIDGLKFLVDDIQLIASNDGVDLTNIDACHVTAIHIHLDQKYFQQYGLWSLLLAWVPIIGDPLTLLSGVLKVRFGIFFLLVSISKISRYVFILYLASFV